MAGSQTQVATVHENPGAQPPQSTQTQACWPGSHDRGDMQVAPQGSPPGFGDASFHDLYDTATFTPAALGMQLP